MGLEDCLYVVKDLASNEPESLFTEADVQRWRGAAYTFESSTGGEWEQKFHESVSALLQKMSEQLLLPENTVWGFALLIENALVDLTNISFLTIDDEFNGIPGRFAVQEFRFAFRFGIDSIRIDSISNRQYSNCTGLCDDGCCHDQHRR